MTERNKRRQAVARLSVSAHTPGAAGLWLQAKGRANGRVLWQGFWAFGTAIGPVKAAAHRVCAVEGFSLMLDLNGEPFVDTNDHQQANDCCSWGQGQG